MDCTMIHLIIFLIAFLILWVYETMKRFLRQTPVGST
jgi:hypothetical protein